MDSSSIVVLSNFPDKGTAERVARSLVEEKLAACVNLIPGVTSIYQWQGEVECESEVTALMKTNETNYAALEKRLVELHPYVVPEVLKLPVLGGLPEYLHWIAQETNR